MDAKPVPKAAAEAVAATGVTPAQAREETLGWAVAAATASSDHWLVIPAHESGSPVVVVPMADRDAFLKELGDPGAPAYLSLRDPDQYGWPERRGPIFRLGEDLRRGMTPRLFVEPWPVVDEQRQLVGQGCSVEVQFWERHPDGALVSPRPNRYTNRIPAGEELVPLEIDGVAVRTLPLMAAPTVNECRFPVDVVYTWVDGDDPEWDAAREARISGMEGTAQTREASGRARFISRDELRYSLRSVHLFAPWVRNIYVVTSGQVPAWLALDHPGVTVVPHAEIMPADALPTFNSHAIETSLHHIPGLAEHWLYFNDDFFLGRPLRPEALFSPAGLSSVFFAQSTIGLSDLPDSAPWLKAAWNNRRLLQHAFGAVTTNALAHAPYAVRTSVLREIEQRFADVVGATTRSPFRSDTDISTLSSFAQHYGLLTGTAYAAEADTEFVNIANPDLDWQLSQLLHREQDFFCLGDHHDHGFRQGRLDELLTTFLREYFPVAAPWEKDCRSTSAFRRRDLGLGLGELLLELLADLGHLGRGLVERDGGRRLVQLDVLLAKRVDALHRGLVVGRLDQDVHRVPRAVGEVDEVRGDLEALPVGLGAVEAGVDEVVDRVVAAGVVVRQPQLRPGTRHGGAPVADQVVVRHERPRVAARHALGLERRVDPGRHVGGLALAAEVAVHVGEVRRVARPHDLCGVAQHRQARQLRAELGRHPLPEVVDPVGAGVLEQDLGLAGRELVAQPGPQLLLDLRGDGLLGDLAGVRPRVDGADRDRVQQPLVELRHPQRLVVAARVALVGLHLGLGDVEAQPLEGARDAARPAPSGAGHHDELHLVCHDFRLSGGPAAIRLRFHAEYSVAAQTNRCLPWTRGNPGVTATRPRPVA